VPVDPVACPTCGFQNAPESNFCSACGTELPARDEATTGTIPVVGVDVAGEDEQGQLVVIRGDSAGARYPLTESLTTIGRHPDSLVFLDDVTVSRRHAEVVANPDRTFTVRDVGSMNGTYLNGDRVQEAALREGGQLQIGRYRLVFVIGEYGGGS
jgi:hypothetical protein